MRYRLLFIFMVLCLMLTACGQHPSTPTSLPTPILRVQSQPQTEPTAAEQMVPTPTAKIDLPAQPANRTQYDLDATLDYAQHTVSVVQQITYFNRANQAMDEILLLVPPRHFGDVYFQSSLTGNGVTQSRQSGIQTMLSLSTALQPGQSITIKIIFTLNLPNRQGVFGWSTMQTNLVDWFPIIPPFNPLSGWDVSERVVDSTNTIVGEYISAETADFSLRLRLAGAPQNLKVAASCEGLQQAEFIEYHLPLARSFSLSISDQFVTDEAQHQGVNLRTYVFPQHREAGGVMLEIAKNALDLFSDLFYPYPRQTLSLVAADFLHNMETDGLLLISKGVLDFFHAAPLNNLTILLPHEISHQWLYSLVGNNPANEPWLDEALATYSESLYFERFHPDHLQWWWQNRVEGFKPKGWVDSGTDISGGYTAYRDAVYLNGANFLQSLRNLVGDEAFFAALKQYITENTYQIASETAFFKAIQAHSSVDLTPLLQQYFENPPVAE